MSESVVTRGVIGREAIQRLRAHGFGEFLEALSCRDVYSVKGTLKLATLARRLGWSVKSTQETLAMCRCVLGEETA